MTLLGHADLIWASVLDKPLRQGFDPVIRKVIAP